MTVGSDKKSGLMCGLLHKKMRSYEHLTHEDGSGKVNGPPTPHLPPTYPSLLLYLVVRLHYARPVMLHYLPLVGIC